MKKGSCLCGGVKFELIGELRPVIACHCRQCRKTSGHYFASTQIDKKGLKLIKDLGLAWHKSSKIARRGFCKFCGSSLFWDPHGNRISIAAGSIDSPTNLNMTTHIYLKDNGDYYYVNDDLKHFQIDRK